MDQARVVLITAPDLETAERLARELVEQRLAACVNGLPGAFSIYRWQGSIERATEVLLIAKTEASRLSEIFAWLERSHPYEVPECIALPAGEISPRYRAWLEHEVQSGGPA
ncbi:MAG: divalent-cation tolerance protein CutA [Planctomycetes bacterium]|jgi:periplasmic divalent cation tolerance protein|nr:divalent-cation tolerance protein CutA [Planctomycetota bacterium]